MFLQASVILLMAGGVCLSACWDTHTPRVDMPPCPPGADTCPEQTPPPLEQTPPRADTPWSRHPPGADPPGRYPARTKYTPGLSIPPGLSTPPRTKYTPWD